MRIARSAVLVTGLVLATRPCAAQSDSAGRTPSVAAHLGNAFEAPKISVWLQSGPRSFRGRTLGGYEGARLVEVGVRWQHSLVHLGPVRLIANPDLLTFASLRDISAYRRGWYGGPTPTGDSVLVPFRYRDGHAFAVGAMPLALRIGPQRSRALNPFIDLSAGLQFFSQAVPIDGASRTNVQLAAGGGLRWARSHGIQGDLAYRMVHISNHNTANVNPGLNFHQLSIAIGIAK